MAPLGGNPPPTTLDDDEEDDYMTMSFTDAPAQVETSLQRRKRLQREAEQRGKVKSKAELAAQEEALREAALSRSLFDAPSPAAGKLKSKGLSMMAKMGFKGGALGAADNESARAEPLRINVRDGREGIGVESERKRKMLEAAAVTQTAAKKAKMDEGEYRDRVRREREEARLERQVHAAQKVAERMDDETAAGADATANGSKEEPGEPDGEEKDTTARKISSRPLKAIPVVYRGLVRGREEAERDRRMRHDLEQSLSRLPTYVDEEEDGDDRKALGKSKTVYVTAEDLDDEDPELDAFNALESEEKLRQLVEYLRKKHNYCFWCKFAYPDSAMEGCPGLTEEDHD